MRRTGGVVLAAAAAVTLTAPAASGRTQDLLRLPLERVVSQQYPAFPVADQATAAGAYRPHPAQCDDPALSCDRVPVEVERSPAGRSDVTIHLLVTEPLNRMELLVYETVAGAAALVGVGRPDDEGIAASFTATGPRYDVVVVNVEGDSKGYALRLAARLVSRNTGAGSFAKTGTRVGPPAPSRTLASSAAARSSARSATASASTPPQAAASTPPQAFPAGPRPVELERALPAAAVPEESPAQNRLWLLPLVGLLALVVAVRRFALTRR
jgi:hypothetical protein